VPHHDPIDHKQFGVALNDNGGSQRAGTKGVKLTKAVTWNGYTRCSQHCRLTELRRHSEFVAFHLGPDNVGIELMHLPAGLAQDVA